MRGGTAVGTDGPWILGSVRPGCAGGAAYTARMRARSFRPDRLDVDAFAAAGAALDGERPLADWPRLADALRPQAGDATAAVRWSATGSQRRPRLGEPQSWLHLRCEAAGEMTCQRCLEPVAVALDVERDFRFVATEAQAADEDDEAEEDVLVASTAFDLLALVEDELVLALPYAPRHADCDVAVAPPTAADDGAGREAGDGEQPTRRPSPFAALAGWSAKPIDDGTGDPPMPAPSRDGGT